MLDSESAGSAVPSAILPSVAATNTATATSGAGNWVDTRQYTGYMLFTQMIGALGSTGIAGKLQCATDANGTGAADVAGATFANVAAANNVQSIVVPVTAFATPFVGYVGTTTGAGTNQVAVVAHGSKRYV